MAKTEDQGGPPPHTFRTPPRVLIVTAPYYLRIADMLRAGARRTLEAAGAEVAEETVSGALELPGAVAIAAEARGFSGYVALGCVIRGETTHYETVCNESARGLMTLSVSRGLAIGNGILTVETEAQAIERADPAGQNKGGGAAAACLGLIALRERLARSAPPAALSGDDDALLLA